MATLSSSSTYTEIVNEYKDAGTYEEDASVGKAKRFITACRYILIEIASSASKGSERIDFDHSQIRQEMDEARKWIAKNSTASNSQYTNESRFYGFDGFRD